MENNVKRMISDMALRASVMAEGAKDVFADASRVAMNKADLAKLNLELVRLRADCESLFAEIGRTFYLMNSGSWPMHEEEPPEQRIETLLCQVSEKEMLANDISDRIAAMSGKLTCPSCGKECDREAAFCSGCGANLHSPIYTEAD